MAEIIVIQGNNAMEIKQERLRVAAYARVSSGSIEQEDSFHNQVQYYTKLIASNPEWEYADIYADEAVTGTRADKRDDFNRMLRDCEDGLIDLIITKSISRFARNTADCLKVLEYLKGLGVTVIFEDNGFNTSRPMDATAITVGSSLAQEESQSIALNVRMGTRNKMRNGTYIQTNAPYGYTYKDGKLIVNPEQAKVVVRIFNEYVSGKSTTEIARGLIRDEVINKHGKVKWTSANIGYIISNVRYKGDALLQKSYTDGFPYRQRKNTGELDMYYLHNVNEPIVSAELFDMAYALLEERRQKFYHPKRETADVFSKMIYCPSCGSPYRKKENGNWVCRTHDSDSSKCSAKPVNEEMIKKAYILMYNKLKANYKSLLIPFIHQVEAIKNNQYEKEQIAELNIQIARISEKTVLINQLKDKNLADPSFYIKELDECSREMVELKSKKDKLLHSNRYSKIIALTKEIIKDIEKTGAMSRFDKAMFKKHTEKIYAENGIITFRLINGMELEIEESEVL